MPQNQNKKKLQQAASLSNSPNDAVETSRTRALCLLERGDSDGAFEELAQTLRVRALPEDARAVGLALRLRLFNRLNTPDQVRRFLLRAGKNTKANTTHGETDSEETC